MQSSPDLSREPQRRGKPGEVRRALATALFTMMKTKPVRDIRISDITSHVGVSQPNFYNHFRDINEALIASAKIGWSRYPVSRYRISPDLTIATARQIVGPIIDFWAENGPALIWVYDAENRSYEPALIDVRRRATAKIIQEILACMKDTRVLEQISSAVEPGVWAHHTLSRIHSFGLSFRLMTEIGNIPRESLIDTAAIMFLSDLGITPH